MFTSLLQLERFGLHFQLSIVRNERDVFIVDIPGLDAPPRLFSNINPATIANSFFGCQLIKFEIWNSDRSTNELESKRKSFPLLLSYPNIGQKHISYYYSFNHFNGWEIKCILNIFMGVWLCPLCCFTTKSKEKLNEKINFSTNVLSWQWNGDEDIVTWL